MTIYFRIEQFDDEDQNWYPYPSADKLRSLEVAIDKARAYSTDLGTQIRIVRVDEVVIKNFIPTYVRLC